MQVRWTQLVADGSDKRLELAGSPTSSEAWKRLLGDKPVAARLERLPEAHVRLGALVTSVVFQISTAVVLILIPVLFPSSLRPFASFEVTPVAAIETRVLLPAERKLASVSDPKAGMPRSPDVLPTLRLSRQTVFTPVVTRRQETVPVPAPLLEAPAIEQTFSVPVMEESRGPVRPREPVKTGTLSAGVPVPAVNPVLPASLAVQTGQFNDSPTQPEAKGPTTRSQAVRVGSLDVPTAAAPVGTAPAAKTLVAIAGFGNVVSSRESTNSTREEVKSGSFAAVVVGNAADRPKPVGPVSVTEPVGIVEKPDPVYSDEARKLRIEGEVEVRAVFLASGSVNVLSVVKGLGHGLDEAAVKSARQIRFKPAQQNGMPVDFSATIRIVFQLAF
jgi:TonB family protein